MFHISEVVIFLECSLQGDTVPNINLNESVAFVTFYLPLRYYLKLMRSGWTIARCKYENILTALW